MLSTIRLVKLLSTRWSTDSLFALIDLWAANSTRPCWYFRIIAFRLLHTLSHPLSHWNTIAFYTCLLSQFRTFAFYTSPHSYVEASSANIFTSYSLLYLHCYCNDIIMRAARLKECIIDINHWMNANQLKLNTEKTELLWKGSRYNISQCQGHGPAIQLGMYQPVTICSCWAAVWAVRSSVSISVPPAATYSCQGSRRTRMVSCHWANDMELVLKWSSWSWSEHWQLSTHSQDVSVWTTRRVLSALEALCDNALYKSTFTFTLHHYPTDSYQSQFIVMMCTDLADVALHG